MPALADVPIEDRLLAFRRFHGGRRKAGDADEMLALALWPHVADAVGFLAWAERRGTLPTVETPAPPMKRRPPRRWTREEIVACMRAEYAAGTTPTARAWQREGVTQPTYDAVRRVFGSWPDAVEESLGYRPRPGVPVPR